MGRFLKIIILIALLVFVRLFQDVLFDDPFILYFKRFITDITLPKFDLVTLIFHVFLRYVLNAILSIGLLYVVFELKNIVKFAIAFYSIALVILLLVFTVLLSQLTTETIMPFFYIRRLLIQPLFVLILLPAFYYQQLVQKK